MTDASSILSQRYISLIENAGPDPYDYNPRMSHPHLIWMCQQIIDRQHSWPKDKIGRWLGFVQGVLAAQHLINVEEERNLSRPLFHAEYKEQGEPLPTSPAPIWQEFGERLRNERLSAGKTVREVGEEIGVSFSVIARIERGECAQPTPRVVAALESWLSPTDQPAPQQADPVRDAARLLRSQGFAVLEPAFEAMDVEINEHNSSDGVLDAALRALAGEG
ncbi:helix-turn-helix transcriptional regulator [uncultured Ruegeria sp.]|uniref:helix-turn-helix domain-containing protein n=1 Tax=uncultured Ruegeria sp. TaxID=259304 RepID=UPI0026164DDD|nr:helix-turn-helix transcriptional regulator [uncultured Ruegeria sp.]